jgi:hypothetical protein
MHCAMTGIEIRDSSEAIWDDGEWISWAWINEQIDAQEQDQRATEANEQEFDDIGRAPSLELLFRILAAKEHYERTLGEISPDWGSIGEAYIAERFDVKLCSRHAEGHDGRLGNELIEIKTITPYKQHAVTTVKRSGNFSILAVVRIAIDGGVKVRFVRRDQLPQGNGGKRIVITWAALCRLGTEWPPIKLE